MGDGTKIQWTEATWNPVRGCSRVSAGCEHCYAEGVARRFAGPGQPYEGLVRIGKDGKPKAQWNGTMRFVPEHLADPLRWTRPRRVFVNSMSDLFHEGLAMDRIARVFAVMALAERHTFQVLTKRAERMRAVLSHESFWGSVIASAEELCRIHPTPDAPSDFGAWADFDVWADLVRENKRLPNVHLGVSVEDQDAANARLISLARTPAERRWVSYEPALGPVRFDRIERLDGGEFNALPTLHWIVIGGESGHRARPFHVQWAWDTIAMCRAWEVPVFVKQLGANVIGPHGPVALRDRKGGDMSEWPDGLRVREWP